MKDECRRGGSGLGSRLPSAAGLARLRQALEAWDVTAGRSDGYHGSAGWESRVKAREEAAPMRAASHGRLRKTPETQCDGRDRASAPSSPCRLRWLAMGVRFPA